MPSPATLTAPLQSGPQFSIISGKVLALGVAYASPGSIEPGGEIFIEGQGGPFFIASGAFTAPIMMVAADARRANNPIYALVQNGLIYAATSGDSKLSTMLEEMVNIWPGSTDPS